MAQFISTTYVIFLIQSGRIAHSIMRQIAQKNRKEWGTIGLHGRLGELY